MEEKKYLKWYNKIGYGSGDIAGNVVYAFLTSFMTVSYTHLDVYKRQVYHWKYKMDEISEEEAVSI